MESPKLYQVSRVWETFLFSTKPPDHLRQCEITRQRLTAAPGESYGEASSLGLVNSSVEMRAARKLSGLATLKISRWSGKMLGGGCFKAGQFGSSGSGQVGVSQEMIFFQRRPFYSKNVRCREVFGVFVAKRMLFGCESKVATPFKPLIKKDQPTGGQVSTSFKSS